MLNVEQCFHSIGSPPLTSSPLMTLTHLLFFIAPLAVAPTLTSPLLFSLSPYLAPGRCFRNCVLITSSNHQITVPLSPVFRSNEHLLSLNFQKARQDDFAFDLDYHCPSAEEYSSLFLSFTAVFFTSLTPNALVACRASLFIKLPCQTSFCLFLHFFC